MRRNVALSPNSASPTTAVTVKPAARTWRSSVNANCHLGANATAAGIFARLRCRDVSHASGRYSVAPSSQARVPVHSATVTAVWQFAILPRAPQYCRATPTDAGPCLGKLVPSRIRTPVRSGTTSRNRLQTASASHGACVMKC